MTYYQYSTCFKYTLTAKMAPNWNIVGDYLINGRDFLTNPLKKNMLKVDVNFTPGKFTITLSPLSMTIPALSVSFLVVLSLIPVTPSVLYPLLKTYFSNAGDVYVFTYMYTCMIIMINNIVSIISS